MKQWILLGSALVLASACNCQRPEEGQKKQREMYQQDDDDRDDGDMCELESSQEKASPAVAEQSAPSQEVPSPEVKAELPVPSKQFSENQATPVVEKAETPSTEAI